MARVYLAFSGASCPLLLDDPLDPGHRIPEGVSTYFRQFAEQLIGLIQRHVPFDHSADFRVSFAFAFHKYASIKLLNRACQDICNKAVSGRRCQVASWEP